MFKYFTYILRFSVLGPNSADSSDEIPAKIQLGLEFQQNRRPGMLTKHRTGGSSYCTTKLSAR